MGQWLTRYFGSFGYDVGIYSRTLTNKTKFSSLAIPLFDSIKDCVNNSDIIIVSVPISKTNQILNELALHSNKNHTIVEISSIKSNILKNMKKLSKK